MAEFIKTVRSETNMSKLFALGEFWKDSVDDLITYVDALGTQVRRVDFIHVTFAFSPTLSSFLVQSIRCPAAL